MFRYRPGMRSSAIFQFFPIKTVRVPSPTTTSNPSRGPFAGPSIHSPELRNRDLEMLQHLKFPDSGTKSSLLPMCEHRFAYARHWPSFECTRSTRMASPFPSSRTAPGAVASSGSRVKSTFSSPASARQQPGSAGGFVSHIPKSLFRNVISAPLARNITCGS